MRWSPLNPFPGQGYDPAVRDRVRPGYLPRRHSGHPAINKGVGRQLASAGWSHQVLTRRHYGPLRLLHWTTSDGLWGILQDHLIRRTWPEAVSEAIPSRVVWLTNRRDVDQGWNAHKDLCAYIEVDLPPSEVSPWSDYRSALPFGTVSALERSSRFWGNGEPATWLVIARDIPAVEWVEVVDLRSSC